MDGGETKKNVPYFVIKVNDDGTITQTKQQGNIHTKPHIIRTPEKKTKDGRSLSIDQKDSLGSSTIKIHEPVGTSAASMLSNILVEAEVPGGKSTRPLIQSKVTAKQATLVRKSLGLPKINVPSKLVLVKPGMTSQASSASSGPQIIKIQPQTTTFKQQIILPKQSRKTPLTARTTDDAIVMEGETDKASSGGIIIQVAPSSAGGVASKIKIPPQKITVTTSPKKVKVDQGTSKIQIIKTVQEIKPKVTPVVRQVIKSTVPTTSTTTTVPLPLPTKGTTSPVKVVIVKEGMQPKPIAPKPAPMTISLVPPPSVVGSPIKIAPSLSHGLFTTQRVVQIMPSVKKTMGPVLKLPEAAKSVEIPAAHAVEPPKAAQPAVAVAPRGRGRGRGKAVVPLTKEAAVKSPGQQQTQAVVTEPAKPEEKPKPASPAKVTPVVVPVEVSAAEASNVEETKNTEPLVVVKAGRGRPKKGAIKEATTPVVPKETAPVVAVVEPTPVASTSAVRRPGRPKKVVVPEPEEVQKPEPPKEEEAPVVAPRGRGRPAKKPAEPEKVVETPAKKAKVDDKKQPDISEEEQVEIVKEEQPVEEKKVPEKKAAPEKKPVPEKKAAPEKKSVPEKKAAPEKKPVPEKKAAPEKKPAPEKKAAPEKKPAAPEKPVPEKKLVAEKKLAVEDPPKKTGKAPPAKKEAKKEPVVADEPVAESPNMSPTKIPEDKGYLFSRPVPNGWSRDVIQRKSGKSAGKYDVYVYSPDGLKHRSRADIQRYLMMSKGKYAGLKSDDFDFSVAKEKAMATPSKTEPEATEEAKAKAKKVAPPKKGAKRQGAMLVVSLPLKRTRK